MCFDIWFEWSHAQVARNIMSLANAIWNLHVGAAVRRVRRRPGRNLKSAATEQGKERPCVS